MTQNGKVVRETIGTGSSAKVLDFIYDESGKPFALRYSTNNGSSFTTYYYVLNLQGDVVKLVTASGTAVATYTYDAWGNILSASGSMAAINPLRYRGYYYDTETGFYYLQSRYYDPANHRFINADSYASTGQGIAGTNMFAYCNNNPVRYVDSEGTEAELLEWWTGFMWWLCAIDGVLPFGDILYALGCVVLIIISFAVVDEAKDSFSELEHESDENTQIEDAGVSAPAAPPNGNRNNKNDTKYRGRSTYNKNGVRVDYEYYGNGSGNVHLHVKGQGKFYYSAASATLYTQSGQLAAASIIKLLKDPEIQRAIEKALKYILE